MCRLTGKSVEAKALGGSLEPIGLAKDLVRAVGGRRASHEASLEVEVADNVAFGGSCLAELVGDGALGDNAGVGNSVAQGAILCHVDGLATRDNNAKGECLITTNEGGGITLGAAGAD